MTPLPATQTLESIQLPPASRGEALLDALSALAEADSKFVASLEREQHAGLAEQEREGL